MSPTSTIRQYLSLRSVALLVTLVALAATAQEPQPNEAREILVDTDVGIETRAGDRVLANVYRPNKPGRYPVLVSLGPYGKDALPARYDGTFGAGQILVSEHAAFETPDPGYWVPSGYVVIAVDSPGSNRSEGDLDIFGPIEANAYFDVIEWAGQQEWSNGNVGLSGVSYFAMSQWYVAALRPPHLKAIMPSDGLTDLYRDVVRHGGIPNSFIERWMEHRITRIKNPNAKLAKDLAQGVRQHPYFDQYWEDLRPDLASINVPAYVLASWSDQGLHTRGTLIGFEQISSEQKWLEVHGRKKWEYYYSRESLERQKRFFDHFLKGLDNGFVETPVVRYERRRRFYDGDFIRADKWPLASTTPVALHLRSDGSLAADRERQASSLSYESTALDEQLAFHFVFDEPTEITGGAKLRLWVEAGSSEDMDLFIGLSKLDRNGNAVYLPGFGDTEKSHVASGWLRVSHRELDRSKSTDLRPVLKHERKLLLAPGEVVPLEIEILPSSTFFAEGETLELHIQGTELETAGDVSHVSPVNSGQHVVHFGGEYDSHLLIPVIPTKHDQ